MAGWRWTTRSQKELCGLWRSAGKITCSLALGSDRGGERAAAMYSLIGTAKLNGLDLESYLRNVPTRIADHPINCIAELLPWNLAAFTQQS